MQFVQQEGLWILIDETAPAEARVIATLRNEVEVVALSEFCKLTLSAPGRIPEHFPVRLKGVDYIVTPLGSPGEKLALVIRGESHSSTIATQFRMPQTDQT